MYAFWRSDLFVLIMSSLVSVSRIVVGLLRESPGQSEVTNLNLTVLVDQDVRWFDVSMDYIGSFHKFETT
jgi:hypothetical protein